MPISRSLARVFRLGASTVSMTRSGEDVGDGPADVSRAEAQLEHLLTTRSDSLPTANEVAEMFSAHRLSTAQAQLVASTLWCRAFEAAADDDMLSDDDLAYLAALRESLGLQSDDAARIGREVISRIYRTLLEESLADGVLTEQERQTLDVVASALRLPPSERERLSQSEYQSTLDRVLRDALADGRLSADELVALNKLEAAFGRAVTNAADLIQP
jgi:hypothetical protein